MKRDDNIDPEEVALRRRITTQLEPTDTPLQTPTPVDAAPFDAAPKATRDPYTPPDPPPYLPPPVTPPGTPTTRFGIPGGPEKPPGSPTVDPAAPAGGMDDRAWFYSLFGGNQGSALTPTQLAALSPQLAARGFTVVGKDSIRSPSGMVIDVIQGANSGQNLAQWLQPDQKGGGSTGSSLAAPTPYTGASSFQAPAGVWGSDFLSQLRTMLMQRLSASQQPVNESDPSIQAPLTAARDEGTRQSATERTQLAERLYAQGGLNTDAITQQIQQSGERNAGTLGGLRATLITRELESRRTELKDLMQMALASGDAEMARQIQMQLGALSAQVQREGMSLDAAKYSAYLNSQAAIAGLRG